MIPVRDRLPTRTVPFINYLLIAVNVLSFLWEQALVEAGYTDVATDFGFVPYHFITSPVQASPTILTSMFMHDGWLHLGGNMLALWIFGDNVEDAVGHMRYLAFYLLGGIAAAMTQLAFDSTSLLPMVGASGAIAAVMGAYLSLYPTSPITILNPFLPLWFFFGLFFELPAWVVALEFFFVNLWSGLQSHALERGSHATTQGGVAFFAHVGGFMAGLVLVRFFMVGRTKVKSDRWSGWRPPERRRRPDDDTSFYR
jgi:membrane associated rhomboid family serine protease